MSRQFLIPGGPFGTLINETASRQYLLPGVVFFSDTLALAADLSGSASGVTTATASLSTSIALSGSVSSVSTATASITTSIRLVGSASCVCTVSTTAGTTGGLVSGSTGYTNTPTKFPQPPPITHMGINDPAWRDWFWKINHRTQDPGQIAFTKLSFAGSNLTDLETRNHDDLQNIQGGAVGDKYHLTLIERDKVNINDVLLWLSF